jgi:bacteriorhodopsin
MSLIGRANDVFQVNPVTGVDEALSVHGSDWLWAVTAIYIVSFVSSFLTIALDLQLFRYSPVTSIPTNTYYL